MAKRKKSPTSKIKKRILSAAGIFTAGSILGAAITDPPDETANITSSLLDSVTEEIAETKGDVLQSFMGEETVIEAEIETETAITVESIPNSGEIMEAENNPDAGVTPETEVSTNWFVNEEINSEEIPPLEIPSEWDNDDVGEKTDIAVDDWFDDITTDHEIVPESPDWMSENEENVESSIVIRSENSSMTPELVSQLEGIAFFWAPSGEKVHADPTCSSFRKGITFAGTLDEAKSVRSGGW